MKDLKYILFALLAIISACSEKKVKQIPLLEGQISNYHGDKTYLYADEESHNPLDTISVDTEGFFTIPKQSIKNIGFYYLQFQDSSKINLFLKPSDYVNLQADAGDLLNTCQSNNSKLLSSYWAIEKINQVFRTEMKKISTELHQLAGQEPNDSLYNHLHTKKSELIDQLRNKSLKIAQQVNSPIIDFVMLNQKAGNQSLFTLKTDLQMFVDNAEQLTSNKHTQALFADYDQKIMQAYTLIRAEGLYQKGNKFPELKARTNWNQAFNLEDTKGKLSHIIFWSGEDLLDDSKLKQTKTMMYRYGNKGLKTVMIAYNKQKSNWLNNIKKHRLPYWHLIDTTAEHSTDLVKLGVRSLPCNFLVDSTGTITNRDLWNTELESAIRSNIEK